MYIIEIITVKGRHNQHQTFSWLLCRDPREKEAKAHEKDAELDQNKTEVNPPPKYTTSPHLWRNVPIPTRETTEVTNISITQLTQYNTFTVNQHEIQISYQSS